MSHRRAHHLRDVTLRLPSGEQYRLELSPEELAEWFAPGRRAPREPDVAPIHVELRHAGGVAVVPVGAAELARWLSRAWPATEAESPIRPAPVRDPTSGCGTRDPAAHRMGPNADRQPDPMHHGPRRHRRLP